LPVGAQIIGPMYEDDTAITFAELLGDVVGGYQRPPVWAVSGHLRVTGGAVAGS